MCMNAAQLDDRLLSWARGAQGADTFEALLLDVYRYQYEHNAAYRRWCEARESTPSHVTGWFDIPAVPQSAFKSWTLAAFDADHAVARFDSSGTTQGTPSRHYFDTLELYEAAIVPPFREFLLPDGAALPCLALLPDPAAHPHSSLAHMAGVIARECCHGRITYFISGEQVRTAEFLQHCRQADEPVLLLTTAFALVHVLDAMEADDLTLALPPGSRMMETGGYKGRTRELPKADLYSCAAARLGLEPTHIVNEYGMAELSSQWYDSILRDTHAGHAAVPRQKMGPPWVRARILNPRTGEEAQPGETG